MTLFLKDSAGKTERVPKKLQVHSYLLKNIFKETCELTFCELIQSQYPQKTNILKTAFCCIAVLLFD